MSLSAAQEASVERIASNVTASVKAYLDGRQAGEDARAWCPALMLPPGAGSWSDMQLASWARGFIKTYSRGA